MSERSKVKITVVKKVNNKDMFGDSPPLEFTIAPECDHFEIGQEFIIDGNNFPSGFCPWAYADLQRDINHLRLGGDYPWMKREGTILAACTDGIRPVIFTIERISEQDS